jgi:hypothetical protein
MKVARGVGLLEVLGIMVPFPGFAGMQADPPARKGFPKGSLSQHVASGRARRKAPRQVLGQHFSEKLPVRF